MTTPVVGATPQETRLDVHGLEVFYDPPDKVAAAPNQQRFHLRIPRLTLRGGELIGIAGRSGEGKSTLLHVLAMLQRPPVLERVEYAFPGEDGPRSYTHGEPGAPGADAELGRLRNEAFGFIFQQHFLLPYFEARDNVALPVMARPGYRAKDYRGRIVQLLDRFGLDHDHRHKRPSQLSGGQNQRVAVVRALMHDPPFLFADEPTANLDKHRRELVLRRLRDAADSGRCVLLVSHELGDLAAYCDRILMVQDNKLSCPFAGDPQFPADAAARPLPRLERVGGRSVPRSREVVGVVTGDLSNLIWPVSDHGVGADGAPAGTEVPLEPLPPQNRGPLGLRQQSFKYAIQEMFNRRGAAMRSLMALTLIAASFVFYFLSDLGQGCIRYLTEVTLNKPSEFLNRFIVTRKDPINRLKPEHVSFLTDEVPGLRAPPTFRQRLFQYEFYNEAGGRERKNFAYSVPEGDDTLRPVDPADRDTAQLGAVYLTGGPFAKGQTDRGGVIVTRRFLRGSYWKLGDADGSPDGKIPEAIEFRLATGDAGADEDDLARPYLPGINGRVRVPVVGVFDYPSTVVKNTRGGLEGLPQVFFPEDFLRRMGAREDKAAWDWYHGFLVKACGEGDKPLVAGYDVLRSVKIRLKGLSPEGEARLKKELADIRSDLSRNLKRPFGNRIFPVFLDGAIVLRLDKAREESSQKLTAEKFEALHWRDIQSSLSGLFRDAAASLEYETQPVSALFPLAAVPPLPAGEERYAEAIVRLGGFQDVLPARRSVERKFGDVLEIEPKGGQVAALERFEAISAIMGKGYLALQITFAFFLTFLIGITAYMHITSKTSDVGILRSYGLPPRSIAFIYGLELLMLTIPASLVGIGSAVLAGRASNDWIARSIVLTAKQEEPDAGPTVDAGPLPRVFLTQQLDWVAGAFEVCKILLLVFVIVAVVSYLCVQMIKRQQIVDCLRGGG